MVSEHSNGVAIRAVVIAVRLAYGPRQDAETRCLVVRLLAGTWRRRLRELSTALLEGTLVADGSGGLAVQAPEGGIVMVLA